MYARHGFQLSYPSCQENWTIHGIRCSSPGLNTKDWTAAQYSKDLMFSESKFCMCFGSQGLRVWRKREEAPNPCCSRSNVKFPQSLMVCGLRSSAGLGPLCFSGPRLMQMSTRRFKSISWVLLLTNFMEIYFTSRTWQLHTVPKLPVPGFRTMVFFSCIQAKRAPTKYWVLYISCSCLWVGQHFQKSSCISLNIIWDTEFGFSFVSYNKIKRNKYLKYIGL